ncbi:MAG TPA: S8 family peptidase [Clostridia bacterium]|nr:S8 family peptidase [Clostridia bacterium]
MNENNSIIDFVNDQNNVDFVVRSTEYFLDDIKDNTQVKLSTVLSGRYVIANVSLSNVDLVTDRLGVAAFGATPTVLGLLDAENLEAAGITQVQQQPFLDLRGNGVLVGIVDTGIDYTLDDFKYEDGTSKIISIFDQSIPGNPPQGFFMGSEYTNEQINQALISDNPQDIVPQTDDSGHGTFLASVAAGREGDDNIGAAPDSELIVVKLRKANPYYIRKYLVPDDQEFVYESSAVMIGVEYIIRKAKELNRPVAICIGVGTNQGGHDGNSMLEEYLTDISRSSGICICTAAGNESQARHHMQGMVESNDGQKDIEIKVNGEPSNIYVTVKNTASDRLSVSLVSPVGEKIARVPAKSGTVCSSNFVLEKASAVVEYYFPLDGSSGQATVVKIINATPGIWTITVHGDIILDGAFHAYLPMTGLGSPEVEFILPDPNYTVVVPSTAIGTITCGAYNISNNGLYANSSWGPTLLPKMSPVLVAPGVNVGGAFPTGYGTMSGTSVATAITTGACALILQWGIVEGNDLSLSTYQVRALLIRGCIRDEILTYPNLQWGYGRLNLLNTFNMMRGLGL